LKPHYPILDGLRGTAAILVVIFHLFEAYYPNSFITPIHHGYLAVDFFFMLSGFVIGYAYDGRWGSMTTWAFFKIRLIRLHPLVVLSAVIGAIVFWFNPFKSATSHVDLLKLIGVMLITCTLLPTPDVHGSGEAYSLNGPLWSLFEEYIANILYAFIGRRMSTRVLTIFVIICAVVLTRGIIERGTASTGWAYYNFHSGVVRVMFPFFAGYLIFRAGKKIRIPFGYVVCSLALIILFMLPYFKYNGVYEVVTIIFIFPVIIAIGAGSPIDGNWAKVCKFSGDISYPIYILHYPFIYIFTDWIAVKKPSAHSMLLVGSCALLFFVLMAYTVLKLYDEPVRAWLKRRLITAKT